VYLQGSSDLIEQRLSNRSGHYMNPVLLDSQFDTLEEPANSLRIDISAPPDKIVATIREHFGLETS
jgi:gluconokinase